MRPISDTVINTGYWLSQPLESWYSVMIRLFHCNPSLTFYGWKMFLNDNKACSTEKMFDLLKDLYLKQAEILPEHKQELERHSHQIPNGKLKLCQECGNAGYHSYLFQFPWLHTCPLHSKPLESLCIECNRPWGNCEEFFKHHCQACGLKPLDEYLVLQYNLGRQDFTGLLTLSEQVDKLAKSSVLWFCWDQYEDLVFTRENKVNMRPSDEDFASVMLHLYPKATIALEPYLTYQATTHKQWLVKSTQWQPSDIYEDCTNRYTRTLSHNHLCPEIYGHIIQLPQQMVLARQKAIKRVHELLSEIHPKTHSLHRSDISSIMSIESDCPLCIAFSCWYSILLVDNHSWYIPPDDPEQNFLYFDGIKNYPKTPTPCKYLATEESYYETPIDFQAFMYEIDLLQCFLQVYEYIATSYVQVIKSYPRTVYIADLENYLTHVKPSQDGQAYFQLHNHCLDGYFPNSYLPESFTLKKFPEIIEMLKKNNPHFFYMNKELYRDGLTSVQYQMLDLLFVHNQFRNHYVAYSHFLESNFEKIRAFLSRKGKITNTC